MKTSNDINRADVPFFELGRILLNCIFESLQVCINKEKLVSSDSELRNCFKIFFSHSQNQRGVNPHFFHGNTKKEKFESRICKIVIRSYQEVQEDSKSGLGFGLPSPLFILQQILTVPDEPQSSAYIQLFCRSLLFETFKVFPEHPLKPNNYQSFNIIDIKSYVDTFNTYTIQHNNIPIVEKIPQQVMLAYFLAHKGVFYFRFGETRKELENLKNIKDKEKRLLKSKEYSRNNARKYLTRKLLFESQTQKEILTFHKLSFYEELPDADSLMNELVGIPIPIRGAETIFQGGIKTDSNSNLVVRISGDPGSGKTSFALALSASMSPFNSFTYYMSLEENPKDLKNRLFSLIPGYLKKLSIYNSDIDSWFWADKIPVGNKNRLEYFETEYIDQISEKINYKISTASREFLPAVCPLIIVIDSIRILLNEKNGDLEKFIEKCKTLNAIIILISANDEKFHHEIDYMVDVVIHLKYFGTNTQKEKPVRILQLSKTRHQISRPGSHLFHLSGEKGLRISPQLPSQIDKKEKIVRPTPSTIYFNNFFNDYKATTKRRILPLRVWDKSQILIHGYGSSGKAGLALNILLSPVKSLKLELQDSIEQEKNRRKILIVSLLYPVEYYNKLKKSISDKIINQNNFDEYESKIECLYFYSGFLTPEDFISRVLRKLDEAILEGEPFSGILLDGLHNVSLQFHKLQDSDMVWPTLYSILSKYKLTIVTTFTNFMIDNEKQQGHYDDNEILLKGHKPLLHALVQATDYHFIVQPADILTEKRYIGKYIVSLKSAIRHKLKRERYVWDRENITLSEYFNVD